MAVYRLLYFRKACYYRVLIGLYGKLDPDNKVIGQLANFTCTKTPIFAIFHATLSI